MRLLKLLFLLAVIVVAAAFASINAEPVNFNYYFGQIDLPLAILLAVAILFGAMLGMFASLSGIMRVKRDNSHLKREVRVAEQEVHNLRSLPIKD